MGYTKLFPELIHSTIWQQPDHVRLLWITMLAMRDQRHEVRASVPGLADAAKIPLDSCERALNVLLSPDPYSRTKDWEGRRISEVDGGWRILNGEKFRQRMSEEDRREYQRNWVAEKRRLKNRQNRQFDKVDDVDTAEQSRAKKRKKEDIRASAPSAAPTDRAFEEFWKAYPKRRSRGDAEKAWKAAKINGSLSEILRSIEDHKKNEDWKKDGGQFIPYPASWIRDKGWLNDLSRPKLAVGPKPKEKTAYDDAWDAAYDARHGR